MKIKIVLKGNSSTNKNPMSKITINNQDYFDGEVVGERDFIFYFNPIENNTLQIEHYNKTNDDTIVDQSGKIISDLSIELMSIHIDGVEILDTVLYSMPYYVKWPQNIVEDYRSKNQELPEYIENNLYFGFNGVYKFAFSDNVVVEYYKQFWLDEVQAHKNQTKSSLDKEVFERMGKKVAIDENSDFTIYDLEKLVLGNESQDT
jgi:hypothetical protein